MTEDLLASMVRGFNEDLPETAIRYRLSYEDGAVRCSGQEWHAAEIGPEGLAVLFEQVQDQVMESVVGGAWPRCPLHGSHPLDPEVRGWECPNADDQAKPAHVWAYGHAAKGTPPPEPARADGEVRWFSGRRGWGVIAHRDGDVWVHFSEIAGDGYRSLAEGQLVQFEPEGRQARFRSRANNVRPVT
jgi:CspA family cold shock protein